MKYLTLIICSVATLMAFGSQATTKQTQAEDKKVTILKDGMLKKHLIKRESLVKQQKCIMAATTEVEYDECKTGIRFLKKYTFIQNQTNLTVIFKNMIKDSQRREDCTYNVHTEEKVLECFGIYK